MGGHERSRDRRNISLLVRNLKYETSPDKLRTAFSKFGEIRDVYLPLDYYSKKPRGFGFVEFYSSEDAQEAMREMDGYEIDGNKIEVYAAKKGRSDPQQMRHRERYSRRRRSRDRSYSRPRRHRSDSYDRRRRRSRSRDRYRSRSRTRSRSRDRYRSRSHPTRDEHKDSEMDNRSRDNAHDRGRLSRSISNSR